ncbi:MAG: tetratricopeptide repeat protein [Actinomycetota bacterium]|nr:tetratricopeptide repeat protein [Actinomycetota bacterium]
MTETSLRLYLFGPPRLERAGKTARFDTKKALALLAYLALESPQSRDHLADLLWPEHDITHARGTLRRTLSAIRSATGDSEILDAERDRVTLRADRLWVDVTEFRAAVEKARVAADTDAITELERAVALGRADVLAGLKLRDAPEFEHWQYRTEDVLRKELGSAFARLVELQHRDNKPGLAIEHARRWVELDPLHEPAHRWLMRLYAESGDRSAAIEQYRACVRVLSEELAVTPLDETTRLYESLTAGASPPPASAPRAPVTAAHEELPLVGRAEEIEVIRRVAAEEGRFVAIEGEAGIGKTRLAHELARLVEEAGRSALEVRCHEEEATHAFGVASRLLHRALEAASTGTVRSVKSASAREASRLIPELAELRNDLGEPPPLGSPGAQTAFFHGVWETLATLVGPGAVVVIDDVQWSDPGSIACLAYGIRRLERLPVIVVATWRRDEVGPEHVLRRVLGEAVRDGRADLMAPPRLNASDVGTLVAALGTDKPKLAARLYEETEGVPFFISEYLKVASRDGGEWPVAPGIKDLVRAQIGRVSEIATQVLTAASVVGRDLTADVLEAVSGRSPDETTDAIDELDRRGLLVVGAPPRLTYDFSHEKVRRVVFDDTSPARRRLLHGRAADHLEHRGEMALAAHHAQQGGRDADAAHLFAAAGARARALFANDEALSHLQAALALGHADTAGLHEQIGDIHTLQGRYGDAHASYQAALAYAAEDSVIARLERRIGTLFLRRGEAPRALSHLRRAVEFAGHPAEKSRGLAELALAAAATKDADAVEIARDALEAAEEAGDDAALARSHNVVGLLAAQLGDLDGARKSLRAGVRFAARLPDPSAHIAALNNLALAERDAGDHGSAITLLTEAVELCEKQGDLHRAAALHNNLADVLHALGRAEQSQEHARTAAELFARVGEDPIRDPGIWKLVSW